jgi:TATA-box binding protein (TBP) (component of TFIID and TFIIIB)
MPKVKAQVNIENVVASATLNQKVDLNAVERVIRAWNIVPNSFQDWFSDLKGLKPLL